MRHVQQHVVLVRAAAAPFLDFLIHRARHEVARSEVLQSGSVALHEALALAVAQNGALAAAALGQQHAGASHARWMELPKLHILQGNAGPRRHAQAIARVDEGIGRGRKDASGAAGGQQGRLGLQDVQLAGLHLERCDAEHIALGVADQVQCHPLDKEIRARLHVLLVEGMQHGMSRTVGCRAGPLYRLFAIVSGVAAKGALVNRPIGVAIKRHAHVFEFIDRPRGFAAHEFDGILIAQPVRTLDGVVEVIVPVVLVHVAQRCTDAALRGHGM